MQALIPVLYAKLDVKVGIDIREKENKAKNSEMQRIVINNARYRQMQKRKKIENV